MVCAEEAQRLSAFPENDRRRENVWKKEKADVVCHVFQMSPYSPPYPKYPTRPSKAKGLGKYLDVERSLFEREARTLIHITPFCDMEGKPCAITKFVVLLSVPRRARSKTKENIHHIMPST